jgi:hypothetical protein
MTDIIDRLHSLEVFLLTSRTVSPIVHQAASEIELLRAENARLRAALDEIAFAPPGACGPDLKGCIRIAREALEMKP